MNEEDKSEKKVDMDESDQHSVLNNITDEVLTDDQRCDDKSILGAKTDDADPNLVLTIDDQTLNDANYNINLNINNLDLKTNATSKFEDEASSGGGTTLVSPVKRQGRISSSSSIEDNSKSATSDLIGLSSLVIPPDSLLSSYAYLWTDTEALLKQYEQTGSSACGATAILNVLVI